MISTSSLHLSHYHCTMVSLAQTGFTEKGAERCCCTCFFKFSRSSTDRHGWMSVYGVHRLCYHIFLTNCILQMTHNAKTACTGFIDAIFYNCFNSVVLNMLWIQALTGYIGKEQSRLMTLWGRVVTLKRQSHSLKTATDKWGLIYAFKSKHMDILASG